MNKAFIFDMDGVLIDSEIIWERQDRIFFTGLLGEKKYLQIKVHLLGNTCKEIYHIAFKNGLTLSEQDFIKKYDEQAKIVYAVAQLTKQIELFIEKLKKMKFKIGLVTASQKLWIDLVLSKFKNKDQFDFILSLGENPKIHPKPSPDGYLAAIKTLNAEPKKTIILEDSNRGIQSAKASGAFTICLQENLTKGYKAKGADMYVGSIDELMSKIDAIKL